MSDSVSGTGGSFANFDPEDMGSLVKPHKKDPIYVHMVDLSEVEGTCEDGTSNTGYRRWAAMYEKALWVYGALAPLTGESDIRHMFSGIGRGGHHSEEFRLVDDPDALTVAYSTIPVSDPHGEIRIYSDRLTADQIETALLEAM